MQAPLSGAVDGLSTGVINGGRDFYLVSVHYLFYGVYKEEVW